MKIKEIMTRDVECIRAEATLVQSAVRMKELGVGCLPVSDGQELHGIITDRDIVIRGIAIGADPNSMKVKEIMTPKVEFCFDDDNLNQIVQKMKVNQIRRMIVIDHDKQLTGIVSLGDISVRGDQKIAENTLERISEPSRPTNRI